MTLQFLKISAITLRTRRVIGSIITGHALLVSSTVSATLTAQAWIVTITRFVE